MRIKIKNEDEYKFYSQSSLDMKSNILPTVPTVFTIITYIATNPLI